MLTLYNIVLLPLRAVSALWAAWAARRPAGAREWSERRARVVPRVPPGGIWIHGASVGEARLVGVLADAIRKRRPELPLCASAYTRTGRGQLPAPPRVDASFFMPLDFPGYPTRLLRSIRPRVLALVETELWPNLLHEASHHGVSLVLVNGRLSSERMSRYRRLKRLYGPLLEKLTRLGGQTADDVSRFTEMGVPAAAATVTGNIKYDLPPPEFDPALLRERFGLLPDRPVLVAGSTGPGEEEQVLEAFLECRKIHRELFLVLAPRHPGRAEEVARLCERRALNFHRLSRREDRRAGSADGLLVDTVGELAAIYGLALAAFVGGSLVSVGGHNVLEPAAAGVPVLFGPHTQHVLEPARALLDAGGALRVEDATSLARAFMRLLSDRKLLERMSRCAGSVIRANRGALDRNVDLVLSVLADDRQPVREVR